MSSRSRIQQPRPSPTIFIRTIGGRMVYPLSIIQWTAINNFDTPDITFQNTGIETLADEYKCPICMELLTNPTSVGSCGHLFCHTCIVSTIRAQYNSNTSTGRCPSCRASFAPTSVRPDNHAKRIIGNLRIKCPNHQITAQHNALISQRQQLQRNLNRARSERSNRNRNSNSNNSNNGRSRSRSRSRSRERNNSSNEDNGIGSVCSWTGTYRELEQHLRDCELKIVCCYKCNIPVLQRELQSHRRDTCPWLPVNCTLCNGRYIKCEKMQHQNVCPKKVVSCRFCEEGRAREDMQQHWDVCDNFPLDCEFKEHGCNEIVTRVNMERHLNEKQSEHLQMMASRLKNTNELVRKYNELEGKYDDLQGNYEELQGDYSTLQDQWNELDDRCNDLDDKCDELEQENEEMKTDHEELKEKVDTLARYIYQQHQLQ